MRFSFLGFVLLSLLLTTPAGATKRSVLFIGNSYTYTNNMPLMVQNIATAMGDTLTYSESDPGGYTLAGHSTYAPTLSLVFSQPWDVVVLQEQSEMPAFPPAEVDTEVYPYAHILDSMIHANDSCTQTMFLMTWGHANGDPPNCAAYPVICTYDGMQQRLHDSYMEMTQANNAIVAPVGVAFRVMMDSFASSIWLYSPDSSHPAVAGSFMEACVMYSSLFHKRVLGCSYNPGVAAADAATIQRIADKVTMDSLYQWQQYGHYPAAVIVDTCTTGYSVNFYSVSGLPASYQWSFGDGVTDTFVNSAHDYPATPQTYTVTLTATNSCFSGTQSVTVDLPCSTTGITTENSRQSASLVIAEVDGQTRTFSTSGSSASGDLEIFNATGIRYFETKIGRQGVSFSFAPGLYVAVFTDAATGMHSVRKFIAY